MFCQERKNVYCMYRTGKRLLHVPYIHKEEVRYDSGARVTSLPKINYISLDTFRNAVHNIDNKLTAWLTFFSSEEPADIMALILAYPEFRELYADQRS